MKLMTANGEEHGLLRQIPNSVKTENLDHLTPEHKTEVQKRMKDAAKTVRARYINRRNPNAKLEKPYCIGGGKPIQLWKLICDHVYDLPKGLVDEINSSQGVVTRGERIEDGKLIMQGSVLKEHECVPVW